MWQPLTSDNHPLSRPKMGDLERHDINFMSASEAVREYVQESIADNTKKAYASDLKHFADWGGTIPATDIMVADYLAACAGVLSVATIARRVAAIAKAHTARGIRNPTQSELVKATLRGIRRTRGRAQRQAKPLIKDDLFVVLEEMGDTIKDVRDRAMLLVGFAGGFRRSELVGIDCADVEQVRKGIVINVRRSKTDQEGRGRKVAIPHGRTQWCPVTALEQWLERTDIASGPIFRSVDRQGYNGSNRLSGEAVSLIVKERVAKAGFDPVAYSGHSLRAGLATSAAAAGVSSWKIRQQTGHASDATLVRYIREGELFVDNAVGALL